MGTVHRRSVRPPHATRTSATGRRTRSGSGTAMPPAQTDVAVQHREPVRPPRRLDEEADDGDRSGEAERTRQVDPFAADREPGQPNPGRDLCQQEERPSFGESEPEHDRCGHQQVHVPDGDLQQHRVERHSGQRPRPAQPGEGAERQGGPCPEERRKWEAVPREQQHADGRGVTERMARIHVPERLAIRIGRIPVPVAIGVGPAAVRVGQDPRQGHRTHERGPASPAVRSGLSVPGSRRGSWPAVPAGRSAERRQETGKHVGEETWRCQDAEHDRQCPAPRCPGESQRRDDAQQDENRPQGG